MSACVCLSVCPFIHTSLRLFLSLFTSAGIMSREAFKLFIMGCAPFSWLEGDLELSCG